MNITILSLRGPTNKELKGGAREYIKELALPWVKDGHNVNLVCGVEKGYDLPNSEIVEGINVTRVSGKRNILMFNIWKYYKSHLKNKTDLLVENMVSYPLFSPIFGGKNNNKITVVHHLTGKEYFKTQPIYKAIIGYLLEEFLISIIYKKNRILTVSNLTKNELTRIGIKEENISIISPGIDNQFYVPGEKNDNPLIVYIGRYDGSKGVKKVDHLITAFNQLCSEINEMKLIIAGPTNYKSELEVLVDNNKNVEILGFITDEKKRELCQQAWIFASPSTREGFGITLIEANACGTPVVGYRIPNLETVPDDSGIFVEQNNVKELKSALKKIILDKNVREKMEKSSVTNAEKYSLVNFYLKSKSLLNR